MTAQVLLALGVVLVVLLILAARPRTSRAVDERAHAWAFLKDQIDDHIEALAAGYLEAGSGRSIDRPGTNRFDQEIELFIADAAWRHAERNEPWLRDAVREIMVLERDAVYGEARARVEAHLCQPSPAGRGARLERRPGAETPVQG